MDKNRNVPGSGDESDPGKIIYLILVVVTVCTVLLVYSVYLGWKCAEKEMKAEKLLTDLAGGNYSDFERLSLTCQAWCLMKTGSDSFIPK